MTLKFSVIKIVKTIVIICFKSQEKDHSCFYIRLQQELFSMHLRKCRCSELLCTLHFYHITIKKHLMFVYFFLVRHEKTMSDFMVT